MKHSNTRALYDYWDALRLSRSAPLRSEIDPRELKAILNNLFILQRNSDTSFSFRLAGTALCQRFGRELGDENFLANWRRNEAASIGSLFDSVTRDRTAAVLGVAATYSDATQASIEYLFLPVRLDATNEIRILGCCSVFEPPVPAQQATIERQEVASLRLLWPGNDSRFMETAPVKAMASPANDSRPAHPSAHQRGHLWVIEGGAE